MQNKNVVITGGAGFIGSNLARTLANENQVVVVDDLSTGKLENIQDLLNSQSITFVKGCITDRVLLQKLFKNVDYVFHEAAIASVPRSVNDPVETNTVNIGGTLNVLLAARDNNVEKVVFASSCAIYGDPETLPIKESTPANPLSPYALSKLVGEYYCQVFTQVYEVSTVSLRYLNVYGPRQDPAGEYAAVVPNFITRVLADKPPVIYGDGRQTRDFIFVSDVVRANILAAENKATSVFNIGSGKQLNISTLAEEIMTGTGKELTPVYEKARVGDIRDSVADVSQAKHELHFQSTYSLRDGLKETIQWFSH